MVHGDKNYAKTITLMHQNSRRCTRIISGTSPSDLSSTAQRRSWRYQVNVRPPKLSSLHLRGRIVSNLLWDIFTGVLMIGKGSCGLMNPPFMHLQQQILDILVQKLTPEFFPKLAVSMTKRLESVFKANGHTTKCCIDHIYWFCMNDYTVLPCFMLIFLINVIKVRGSGNFLRA